MPMHEKSYRSILKSISWRITGSLDTTIVSFIVTGSIKVAASIGFIEVFTKIILYYFHERIWNKIKLGKEEKNDPEYNI
jgi:uncharacterized membrane protein